MEAKDWLTMFASWAALGVAGYSLWLTKRRDARDTASKDPVVQIHLGRCRGYGPWDAPVSIDNKLPYQIDIEGIFPPEAGRIRLIERRRQKRETIRTRLGQKIALVGTDGYRGLQAGGALSDLIHLEPADAQPLTGPTPIEFWILYRRQDDMRKVHRIVMQMIASP